MGYYESYGYGAIENILHNMVVWDIMHPIDMMDGNSRNELIMGPLAGSFDAAMKNPDFKNVLNEFLDTFKSFNQ